MTRKAKLEIDAINKAEALRREHVAQQDAYYVMIEAAAAKGKREMSQAAMAGLLQPAKLCYRKGELLLVTGDVPDGFTDSGRLMPISTPYAGYSQWIVRNSGDLAIF